jgi:hypothetical protein
MRWTTTSRRSAGERSDVVVDLVDVLDTLGARGWELASALPLTGTDTML